MVYFSMIFHNNCFKRFSEGIRWFWWFVGKKSNLDLFVCVLIRTNFHSEWKTEQKRRKEKQWEGRRMFFLFSLFCSDEFSPLRSFFSFENSRKMKGINWLSVLFMKKNILRRKKNTVDCNRSVSNDLKINCILCYL